MFAFRSVPVVVTLMLVACSLIVAQTEPVSPLTDSSRAVMCQIGSDFTLQSFQGLGLQYKYHYSALTALRFGISLSMSGNKTENNDNYIYSDTTTSSTTEGIVYHAYNTRVQALIIKYLEPKTDIHLFFGAGPTVAYAWSNQSDGRSNSTSTIEYHSETFSAGLVGVAGTEWFATRTISLFAEYDASLYYSHTSQRNSSYNSSPVYNSSYEAVRNSWNLSNDGIRMGLSLYFR
jgi:hypothetical protein